MSDFSATSAASNRERLLASVVDACLRDIQQNKPPRIEKYVAQYPELAGELESLLPALCAMGQFEHAGERAGGNGADHDLPDFPALAEPVAPRAQLGDFVIHRELGRGGMGVVYEAQQVSLNRPVALKVLPFASVLEPSDIQRFKNEAQIAAQVHHPHIVPVYAVGCENGVHYYAMQLIEGQTLAQLIKRLSKPEKFDVLPEPSTISLGAAGSLKSGKPPSKPKSGKSDTLGAQQDISTGVNSLSRSDRESFRTIARWGIQAAEALHYAHSLGLVHRDIKPSNLLLDAQGKLWVSDFGLAKVASGPQLTLTGDLVGTIAYMSPEQTGKGAGVVDHRSDIYSLGATLYELAGLRRVFTSGNRMELLQQVAHDEPKPLRDVNRHVPLDFETIIHKALSKEPNNRYATAHELAEDLGRFLEARPIHARRPSLTDRAGKWMHRHRVFVMALSVVLLLTTLGSLVSAVLIYSAKRQTDVALEDAREQKAAAEKALEGERLALSAAREQEVAALEALAREGDALELAESQSEVAREAVDDMYYELVRDWLWDTPHRTRVQEDFMRKALEYYEGLSATQLEEESTAFGYASVLGQMGLVYYGLGDYPQAHDFYAQSSEILEDLQANHTAEWEYRNRLAHVYIADAQALEKLGRFEEMCLRLQYAKATIDGMLAIDPQNGRLEVLRLRLDNQLGIYSQVTRDLSLAEEHWSQALQREPPVMEGDTEIHRAEMLVIISCHLANLLTDQDRTQDALDYLSRAREQLLVARRQGEALAPVLLLERDLAVAENRAYGMALRYEEALQASRQANEISLKLLNDFPEVRSYAAFVVQDHIGIAILLILQGQHGEAEQYVGAALNLSDQMLEHHPQNNEYRRDRSKLMLCAAHILSQRGNWDRASDCYKDALRLSLRLMDAAPGDATFRKTHMENLLDTARFYALVPDETLRDLLMAQSAAARAIDLYPDSRGGYRMLAVGLCQAGRFQDAIEQIEHTNPARGMRRTESYLTLALAYSQVDEEAQALESYDAALEAVTEPGEYRDALTDLLFHQVEETLGLPHQETAEAPADSPEDRPQFEFTFPGSEPPADEPADESTEAEPADRRERIPAK